MFRATVIKPIIIYTIIEIYKNPLLISDSLLNYIDIYFIVLAQILMSINNNSKNYSSSSKNGTKFIFCFAYTSNFRSC